MVQEKSHRDAHPATRRVPFRHEILRRYDALILALCLLFSFAPRFLRRFSASRNKEAGCSCICGRVVLSLWIPRKGHERTGGGWGWFSLSSNSGFSLRSSIAQSLQQSLFLCQQGDSVHNVSR